MQGTPKRRKRSHFERALLHHFEGLQLRQDQNLLRVQRDVGTSLLAGGAGLSTVGAVLMVSSSAEFENRVDAGESTVQVAAIYAGGLGMVGSGIAMAIVGLPITLDGVLKLRKLSPSKEVAQGPPAQLELGAEGLTLRF